MVCQASCADRAFLSDGALWPWNIVLQQINFVAASLSMLYTCVSLVHVVQNADNSNVNFCKIEELPYIYIHICTVLPLALQ